jgi:hypothetical protein
VRDEVRGNSEGRGCDGKSDGGKHRYTAGGEPVAPEGHPREWNRWLLEIDSVEFEAIHDHVDDGDIVDMKPVSEPASS